MTPVDHRRPPARAARRQQKSPGRPAATPAQRPAPRSEQRSARKAQRSHSAIGAAIVAAAAMVAIFAFILTRGSSQDPPADGLRLGSGADVGAAGPAAPASSSEPNTTKADRNPPASAKSAPRATKPQVSTPPVDTGPVSPKFRPGQWIVVLEKYTADVGDAEKAARDTATKLSKGGIPAKAMLVNGQYPGMVNSSWEPVTNTWFVYLGPGTTSKQVLNQCSDTRTQRLYSNPACPTYEPAVRAGG
ncbi:hypothetical protein AB0E69_35635 [Kribbella sp. NPDC026611]|uniref:hypothetical protein n=1 Tax=Kribbella sp. NPDC026611 TaxID=3154911 RepID=UPI0033E906EB